jgi:hypothetical protein
MMELHDSKQAWSSPGFPVLWIVGGLVMTGVRDVANFGQLCSMKAGFGRVYQAISEQLLHAI